jgi:hypothetical protein
MNSHIGLFALATAGVFALSGCHSISGGPTTSKSFALAGFDRVSASAGVDVVLKQGPFNVSASGPEKHFDTLRVEANGSTLEIGRHSHGWFSTSHDHFIVTVSAPTYTELHASSGSDLKGEGLRLANLRASVSSGADMKVSGSCKQLDVEASSGADFKGDELKCESVQASASSGADAIVFASISARGHASSGADIKVLGHPSAFDHEESSGGSVKAP